MRILFDQGTPAPLRSTFVGHEVRTAFEMGWSGLGNGELLAAAEAAFDLLIEAGEEPPGVAAGVLALVRSFERDVALVRKDLPAQGRLAGLPGTGDRHRRELPREPPKPAGLRRG
jgi:hypothetical protein